MFVCAEYRLSRIAPSVLPAPGWVREIIAALRVGVGNVVNYHPASALIDDWF